MPRIIDYPQVLATMQSRSFVSLYHNSGAFGFDSADGVKTLGFAEDDDPTIRPEARAALRKVDDVTAELDRIIAMSASDAWLMPKSHWHYELHFGNRELLESALPQIGIDPAALRERNDGSAVAFSSDEHPQLCAVIRRLLRELTGSDFLLAFADAATLVTIHHHKQLWVQTRDPRL